MEFKRHKVDNKNGNRHSKIHPENWHWKWAPIFPNPNIDLCKVSKGIRTGFGKFAHNKLATALWMCWAVLAQVSISKYI